MKPLELRKKSTEELLALVGELIQKKEDLSELARQKKAKNVRELRGVRQDIARIHSILHETKTL